MAKRTRYQYGSVEIDKRVKGPDVWLYRWWEATSDGRRKRRGFTVGTVEQYKTEAHALKAAEGMRLMINDGISRREPVLFCGVLDRFLLDQKQEQEAEQITYNTLASYRSMIGRHIRPKWGDTYVEDVRPALVQDWLRRLEFSPKYKGHIRSLMYRLFDKAMLWELLRVERNPMDLVEVKGISKRKKRPRILQVKDAWQILDVLVQPFRTIVLIALCFGLRISEILGLRWTDFDFKRSVVLIQRSAVGKRLNKLKTEYSEDEVPLERGFILELKKWQMLCRESEEDGSSRVLRPIVHITQTQSVPTTSCQQVSSWDLAGSGSTRSATRIVRGWTKPEHLWVYSRNSCDTRTFPPQWTSMAMPRLWPSARPIGQSCNAC